MNFACISAFSFILGAGLRADGGLAVFSLPVLGLADAGFLIALPGRSGLWGDLFGVDFASDFGDSCDCSPPPPNTLAESKAK